MSSREMSEWIAYDRIEPIDWPSRIENMLAMLCATLANCHRGKGTSPFKTKDFIPRWDQTLDEAQTEDHMREAMKSFAAAMGQRKG